MGGTLGAALFCCIILMTLFHGSFGNTYDGSEENKDEETIAPEQDSDRQENLQIMKNVFLRRVELIANAKNTVHEFLKTVKAEIKNLEEPYWSDAYREFVTKDLADTITIIKKEHLNRVAKQLTYYVRDVPHLDLKDESLLSACQQSTEDIKEMNKYEKQLDKIKIKLINMYDEIQERNSHLPVGSEPMSKEQFENELSAVRQKLENIVKIKKKFRNIFTDSSSNLEAEIFDFAQNLEDLVNEFKKIVVKSTSEGREADNESKGKGSSSSSRRKNKGREADNESKGEGSSSSSRRKNKGKSRP